MPTMRAVQVPGAKQPFQTVQQRGPGARARPGPRAGRGLRRLPQRRPHEGGRPSRDRIPAGARPRGRGRRRRDRRGRTALEARRPRRDRLARRPLRILRLLPARRLPDLPQRSEGDRHRVRRGLRRLRRRALGGARPHPRRAHGGRGRSAHVRGRHDLQSPPQLRRASGRPRRRPRHRRPRASRRAVFREDGLRHRRDRPRRRQGAPREGARRARLHRQPGSRTRPRR